MKKITIELSENKRKMKSLVKSLPIGIFQVLFESVSEVAESTGLSRQEIVIEQKKSE